MPYPPLKSLLLSGLALGLLISSSQALAFDPNAALRQQRAQQAMDSQAQQARDEQAFYERYRNKGATRIDNDGIVTIGNLQWMRCSFGQQWNGTTCTGHATKHNWHDAYYKLPDWLNARGGFAGYRDWRLPTISELASLRVCSSGRASGTVNLPGGVTTFLECLRGDGYSSPTLDTRFFPNTPAGWFWSSSPMAGADYGARSVHFDNSSFHNFSRSRFGHVRLVRAVQ